MAVDRNARTYDQEPQPNPLLGSLEVMVGTWRISGRQSGPDEEIRGQVSFEWMEGGFYLVQQVAIDYIGCKITGVEYVGYDDANGNLRSYFFGNEGPGPSGGVALEYVWEVDDDTLTIWGGEVGSPANFRGRFSDDRGTIAGRWTSPSGGYEATLTRLMDKR